MTFNKLCSEIAKREGKKVEVSIGNIREIMRIFFDIAYESEEYPELFNREMEKRSRRKRVKK